MRRRPSRRWRYLSGRGDAEPESGAAAGRRSHSDICRCGFFDRGRVASDAFLRGPRGGEMYGLCKKWGREYIDFPRSEKV